MSKQYYKIKCSKASFKCAFSFWLRFRMFFSHYCQLHKFLHCLLLFSNHSFFERSKNHIKSPGNNLKLCIDILKYICKYIHTYMVLHTHCISEYNLQYIYILYIHYIIFKPSLSLIYLSHATMLQFNFRCNYHQSFPAYQDIEFPSAPEAKQEVPRI